ncbi:MAG: hypothetical protein JWO80_5205 [Bryobacterales bacterium]|nr:hypothetical protein [Bryobacterales bacterium]
MSHTNRLAHEKSPYLLQHAHNPVDWYAWGPEAFERARAENKPIFLSIGYSTCHWCHVMERESFENDAIAAILNQHFVSIKVDREERPDIDRIYMAYVQAATGSGGWPMSVWLTPDLHPFVGGTYFPPADRYGRPGFPAILERIATAWRDERPRIVEQSALILDRIAASAALPVAGAPSPDALDSAFNYFRRTFDSRLGGFGQAPKFPRPVIYNFLLRYHARTGNAEALEMTLQTLRAMSRGGMNDHLGGGFHRYSVDEYWFVPHFEKMLYDQAQLAISYTEAFQITHDEAFAREARRILDYVLRDMTHPEGGFYSAEDADSATDPDRPREKSEGAFYIWSKEEIEQVAGPLAARYFRYRYGVEDGGNVHNDPHEEFAGRNILFEAHTVEETAHHFDAPVDEARRVLDNASLALFVARAARPRPHLDDKILTSWNGLMISAFARAGAALDEPRYTAAARRAADFIRTNLMPDGTLLRRFREGDAAIPAFLDDYAAFTQALLDLFATSFDARDLALAIQLAERQSELFEDQENGAFFNSSAGGSDVVLRMKEEYDGAEPSANSIAAMNLLRLARITGRADFQASADRTLHAFASRINEAPFAVPQMVAAFAYSLSAPKQVVIAGEGAAEMLRAFHSRFLPDHVLLAATPALAAIAPATAELVAIEGKPTAYVCENYLCHLPTTSAAQMIELLQ